MCDRVHEGLSNGDRGELRHLLANQPAHNRVPAHLLSLIRSRTANNRLDPDDLARFSLAPTR